MRRVLHEEVDHQARTLRVTLTEDELLLIANALNEVCNGVEIDDFEFATRIGVDRARAREVLSAVGAALDRLPPQ